MSPTVLFTCQTCGKPNERYVVPSRQSASPARFCDRTCAGKWRKGENHPRWNGGRYLDSEGYVYVLRPEHPNANSHGAVFEHRLVMEVANDRYLTRGEVVHHENDDPGDNRERDGAGRYVTV